MATATATDQKITDRLQAELARLLAPRLTKYITHVPEPKQQAFLLLDDREALYGGAAGGGKSDALLMGSLQYADVPGYNAIIFRRTFKELALPEAIMARSMEWLAQTDARFDGDEHRWTFPSGATLTFAHLQYEQDKYNYQSAAFQFIGFDELTEFTEGMYLFLFSRLRRLEGVQIPLRMRSASNPGNIGHEWVKQRFLVEKHGPFIPAWLSDNPFLDQDEYRSSLAKLDPITRAQLESGDWDIVPAGNMFAPDKVELLEIAPATTRTVRFWDLASTAAKPGTDPDWTVGVKMGITALHDYVVFDVIRLRADAEQVDRTILNAAVADGRGTSIRIEQEPGSSGKRTIADFVRRLRGYDVRGVPSTGSKQERARPLAAQWYAGNVKAVRGTWYTDWVREHVAFGTVQAHDDQVDATSGAFSALTDERGGRFKAYG